MQRRSREPTSLAQRVLLIGLVIAALLRVGGTLRMGFALRRGVTEIQAGLARLETDFSQSVPEGSDELGEVSPSINRMAGARRS
jgi:methyl-accepting chemotaxis protein